MSNYVMRNLEKVAVSNTPPYDPLQAFVRDNHIAMKGLKGKPLSNYVFAAKDVFKVKGSTWGNGHPDWLRFSEPDDFTASAIMKLLDAGADLVGKTVCDELCYSISGENWHYGSPLNPNDTRRLTGGSSSGSCAATAGGLVDFAIGSDCLGSVRVPASYNGIIGLRPTYERIENDGEAPYCESMDVLGFVASEKQVFQDVADILLEEDPSKTEFNKLYIIDDAFAAVDKEVEDAFDDVINKIGDRLGHVEHITLAEEGLDYWVRDVFQIVQGYEIWESYGGFINKYRPRLSPGPKERLEKASMISRDIYLEAKKKKEEFKKRMEDLMSDGAVMITPTASSVAPLKSASLEEINRLRTQSSKLLCISPLAGIPQLTLPLLEQEEVPLGVTLMSAKNTDRALIDFGLQFMS
ncbi:amidase [Alkalibacterium kapii]|uniref:Amidase n=1 Tax=Alkalibacterium kapii TaxID=426704 RepID=A0A511AYF0_9LACT|nr:amidase [Alkalibacterium kapii]GEK92171.1 amidase [Alkalibacterium kapii]